MTSALYGAKEARKEIEKFHRILNHESVVPDQCYRVASLNYKWVTYANHIIGLILSKNYDVIPLFLQRANKEMNECPVHPNTQSYRSLLNDYMCQVAFYLVSFTESAHIELIPKQLIESGSKKAPEVNLE